MSRTTASVALCVLFALSGAAMANSTYHVLHDFEASWAGDYAPGWENLAYRHGTPPVGKMMEQVAGGVGGGSAMKLIVDSVPADWMWWAGVNPVEVNPQAMQKQFDPWISVWYLDEGYTAAGLQKAGQVLAVPSWVNLFMAGGTEDWTDIQFGGVEYKKDNYYFVAVGDTSDPDFPGWVDTGVARPDGDVEQPRWVHLKMQLLNATGQVHFSIDTGSGWEEVGTSWRDDYVDLGTEIGLYTRFDAPLSGWGADKPATVWDNFEYGSSYVPEPLTMVGVLVGAAALGGYVRRRRAA